MADSTIRATGVLGEVIQAAKKELERMIDLVPQGMFLMDGAGKVLRANARFLKLTRMRAFRDVLGWDYRDLFAFEPGHSSRAVLDKLVADARKGADVTEGEVRVLGAQGKDVVLLFCCVPAGVESELYVMVVEDVTDRKRAIESKERSEMLRAVQSVVGALLHTVNQPLTVMATSAHLIRAEVKRGAASDGARIDEHARQIEEMVERVADALKKADRIQHFVLEPYHGGVSILDLDKSARRPGESDGAG